MHIETHTCHCEHSESGWASLRVSCFGWPKPHSGHEPRIRHCERSAAIQSSGPQKHVMDCHGLRPRNDEAVGTRNSEAVGPRDDEQLMTRENI